MHTNSKRAVRNGHREAGMYPFARLSVSVADLPPNSLQQQSDDDFEDHVGFRVRLD
jgi:hypothetical protein